MKVSTNYMSKEFMTLLTIGTLGFYGVTGTVPPTEGLESISRSVVTPIISTITGIDLEEEQEKKEKAVPVIEVVGKPLMLNSARSNGRKANRSASSLVMNHGPIFLY